jgi:hypothetical protein
VRVVVVSRRKVFAMSIATIAVTVSCTPKIVTGLPPSFAPMVIRMRDFKFEVPHTPKPGRNVFRLENHGTIPHNFHVYAVPSDAPSVTDQAVASDFLKDTELVHTYPSKPGAWSVVAVNLKPNERYMFICRIADPGAESHYAQGMLLEFRTQPSP